jgi:hypothetical protein
MGDAVEAAREEQRSNPARGHAWLRDQRSRLPQLRITWRALLGAVAPLLVGVAGVFIAHVDAVWSAHSKGYGDLWGSIAIVIAVLLGALAAFSTSPPSVPPTEYGEDAEPAPGRLPTFTPTLDESGNPLSQSVSSAVPLPAPGHEARPPAGA